MKVRMTAGPASWMAAAVPNNSPVPIEPPTATMVICPALSWWRSPDSGLFEVGLLETRVVVRAVICARTHISEAGGGARISSGRWSCGDGDRPRQNRPSPTERDTGPSPHNRRIGSNARARATLTATATASPAPTAAAMAVDRSVRSKQATPTAARLSGWIAETHRCPHELKSAMLMENSSPGVSSPICSPNFRGRQNHRLPRVVRRTELMTFVIAGWGNRVAGAGGES